MQRLQIRSVSPVLPMAVVAELNKRHESLVRVVDLEFAETGFYELTSFRSLELTQELLDTCEPALTLRENLTDAVLCVTSTIPVSHFDLEIPSNGFEYAREHAVQALAEVAEQYDLNARALAMRAFHIRGSLQGTRIRAERMEETTDAATYHSNLPDLIPVKREVGDGSTKYIGMYGQGNQFWGQIVAVFRNPVTELVAAGDAPTDDWTPRKCWYAILHKFDSRGNHLETDYQFTGTTADGEGAVINEAKRHMDNFIKALGRIKFGDIAIRLFEIEIDGHIFGMIDTSSAECGDTATMEPADLVFHPPWNGEYDT